MTCPVVECTAVCDLVVMQASEKRGCMHARGGMCRLELPHSPSLLRLTFTLSKPLPPWQNVFSSDLVFSTAELLAAWKPNATGC